LIALYEWIWVRTLNVETRRTRIGVTQILSQFNNKFLHSMFSGKKTYLHITADFKRISKPITLSYQATAYFTGLS
jgi:hypothetical protein